MIDYMVLPFRRYAEFSGRSRRTEYWMFTLLQVVVVGVLVGLIALTAPGLFLDNDPAGIGVVGGLLGLVTILWLLASFIPSLAVTIRRLHDRDMSGWWYLGLAIASAIPLIGIIASIALLVLMLLPGTPGENRFGPDPKLAIADLV